jgi:hypothetical protein
LFVVCCQIEVSATNWSLAQRSPIDCGASLCVIKKSRGRGGHSPRWAGVSEKHLTETKTLDTRETCPLVSKGATIVMVRPNTHQNLVRSPRRGSTPRWADWLTWSYQTVGDTTTGVK